MRIWGSEHEDVRKLMNFQEKAKEHSSSCMIVEICEDFDLLRIRLRARQSRILCGNWIK